VDRHFYTDGLGTVGHQIGGAWNAGTGVVRDEYGDIVSIGQRARGMFRRHRDVTADNATDTSSGSASARTPRPKTRRCPDVMSSNHDLTGHRA
jgi:hypothetical protein